MIGFLKGQIDSVYADYCLIDVGGVGYRVFIADSTRGKLQKGEIAKLYTYLSVREDAMHLYGFYSEEEHDLFQLLITVKGIGPKVALGIIGAITPAALCQAIQNKNIKALTKLPGIGKKSAEQMIVDLKDKLKLGSSAEDLETAEGLFAPVVAGDDVLSEAIAALMSLGYSQAEVNPVIDRVAKKAGDADVQSVIKLALAELSRR